MIPIVNTQFLIEEKQTDGHSPMYFLCSNGNAYYCKYRTQLNKQEFDCLVYELVCHFLLKLLNVPTPDIALAIVQKDSYDIKKLHANKRYIKPGIVCFASKEAANTILVTGIQSIQGKTHVRKFENIYDLLRIAIFDLWINNDDRGKGSRENYNLLLQTINVQNEEKASTVRKLRWLAFDHAFAFGGQNQLRMFNETMMPTPTFKLIESQYFNYFKKYFTPANYKSVIENFLPLQNNEIENTLHTVFSQIPDEWQTPPNLADRIFTFLSNSNRINSVKQIAINSLKK